MPAKVKKLIFSFLLLFSVVFSAGAPDMESVIIFESPVVKPYDQLMFAIGFVETMNNNLAYNPREEATGYFQIRPIRLLEYNRRTGSSYKMKDLFNYEVSEKIFLYFADLTGPYDFEQIARKWNGSGHMTTFYWNRIRQYL
jgi:hypothetical protein